MARLFLAGNEFYDYRADGWVEFTTANPVVTSVPTGTPNQPGGRKTAQGNGGKYYYYIGASSGTYVLAKQLPNVCLSPSTGGYTEMYARFAFQSNASTAKGIFSLRNSNTGLIVGQFRMVDAGSPNIFARVNAGNATANSLTEGPVQGALPIQSVSAFNVINFAGPSGSWRRIELHFKCAASGGIWEVWIDDVLFISNSALNTSNGTTVCFDQILIGQTEQTGQVNYYDDIGVNDLTGGVNNARLGEGFVLAVFPTRTGTFSQLTNTFNSNAENYDHVNKPITTYVDPYNNSLFVGTNTPYAKDSYKMASLPQEFGGIAAVKVVANAARNGTAITNAKLLLEPGVTAPVVAPTGAVVAGGSGTAGTHVFSVVNKIGGAWSLPSPLSAPVNLTGGNLTANLTIPVAPVLADPQQIVSAREIYASKANTDTMIDTPSNGQLFPNSGGATTIFVVSAAAFNPVGGTAYIANNTGAVQAVTYTGTTGTSLTGCSGGVGTMATGGIVVAGQFLVGTVSDNVTTVFAFAIADGSFGTLTVPVEVASANILLQSGGFGYIENIFNNNPTTGLAWSKDEIEQIEAGIQFVP